MPKGTLRYIPAIISTLFVMNNAFSVSAGFYFGAQLGYANVEPPTLIPSTIPNDIAAVGNTSRQVTMHVKSPVSGAIDVLASPISFAPPAVITSFSTDQSTSTFLGRFFAGYQFFPWIAAEFGFGIFGNVSSDYNATTSPSLSVANILQANGVPVAGTFTSTYSSVSRSDDISTKVIDLFIKLSYPIYDILDVYAKLGGAYVMTTTDTKISIDNFRNGSFAITTPSPPAPATPGNGTYFSTSPLVFKDSQTSNKLVPAWSIGASYYTQSNLGIDISYTTLNMGSNDTNISYYALGIAYHFVNRYCGQFLCD